MYKILISYLVIIITLFFISCEDTEIKNSNIGITEVIINEINYNSLDSYDPDDWIEIYNNSSDTINMGSWLLKDDSDDHIFIVPSNALLPPNQYMVFCKDTLKFKSLFPNCSLYYGDLSFGLGGGSDFVRLFNPDGLLIDFVEYDDDEPWPILADGNGPTLELKYPSLDNSIGENWLASNGYGTPGSINSVYTNE